MRVSPLKAIVGSLLFCVLGLAVAQANGDLPTTPSQVPTGAQVLAGLPTNNALFPQLANSPTMEYLGWTCMLFGGVFLLWGHAARTENKRGDEMVREQVTTWMTLAAMVTSSFLLGNLANISDQALANTVKTPAQIGRQIALALDVMPDPSAVVSKFNAGQTVPTEGADPAAPADEGGFLSGAWRKLTNIAESATGLVKGIAMASWEVLKQFPKIVATFLLLAFSQMILLLAQISIWLVEQVRYLILVIGGAFLPLFISSWGLNRDHWFFESGRKFTISMMCVALWPFAWIIFGLLTSSFFAAWIKCMAGVGIWDGAKLTTVLMDDVATNISSGEIIDAMSSGQQMVQNITMTGLGPLLALTLGTAFLALWLIFAPFKLAFWFQDMLISGANKVMDGALSGAKGAAKLAATAGGGVVAGSGAVLARGGGSALTQKIMGSEGAKAFGRMASAAGEAMGEAAQTGEKSSREGTSKASADMAAAAYKVFRAASAKASN